MKNIKYTSLAVFFSPFLIFAQLNNGDMGNYNPNDLTVVTKTGITIVDSSSFHLMYYLDENNDGTADYFLNFGPFWYEPDSSSAVRPNDGDQISVTGGLHESLNGTSVIVVYEIENEFWREPFDPFWNNIGNHNHNGGHHSGECSGYTFGFEHDPLLSVEITGVVFIDTTFYMSHYYLDSDEDGAPDYILNFGPYWYTPDNGIERPVADDTVTIVGGQIQNGVLPMLIVYEINGNSWRDSALVGSHFGGGWFSNTDASPTQFHNMFDENDKITINPGWQMGGMMNDSLFCQLFELYPENIPGTENESAFAGFEIGMFSSNGMNNMSGNGGCGGRMNFGNNFQLQFHYSAQQVAGIDLSSNSIIVKFWNDQSASWDQVNNAVVDLNSGTVSFTASNLSSYYILSTNSVTAVSEKLVPQNFSLKQNFPNPFNPSTVIEFSLGQSETVSLTIYNSLGEVVRELFKGVLPAGIHKFNFDAGALSSGLYLYRLVTSNSVEVKKMQLLK